MRFDIMTLFPASVDAMMQESILGRAQRRAHTKEIDDPRPADDLHTAAQHIHIQKIPGLLQGTDIGKGDLINDLFQRV